MNKLKLMLLSTVLLTSQLNGLMVKFTDQPAPIYIEDELIQTWMADSQIARIANTTRVLNLDIPSTDFNAAKEILLVIKNMRDSNISEDQQIEILLKYLQDKNQETIGSLIRINNVLRINILRQAIDRLPAPAPSVPPSVSSMSSIASSSPQSKEITLKFTDGTRLNVDKQIALHSTTLKNHFEFDFKPTEVNLPEIINSKTMGLIVSLTKENSLIKIKKILSSYSLEQLNDILGALNYLHIQPLRSESVV